MKHSYVWLIARVDLFTVETYPTLLKRDLRSNLFSLFRNWSGPYGSSLMCHTPVILTVTTTAASVTSEATCVTEEELQFASLQAMSAVLCCGPCFDVQHFLSEDGTLYGWLDTLLASKEEKVCYMTCCYTANEGVEIGITADKLKFSVQHLYHILRSQRVPKGDFEIHGETFVN